MYGGASNYLGLGYDILPFTHAKISLFFQEQLEFSIMELTRLTMENNIVALLCFCKLDSVETEDLKNVFFQLKIRRLVHSFLKIRC